jgi:hypothetical protein
MNPGGEIGFFCVCNIVSTTSKPIGVPYDRWLLAKATKFGKTETTQFVLSWLRVSLINFLLIKIKPKRN